MLSSVPAESAGKPATPQLKLIETNQPTIEQGVQRGKTSYNSCSSTAKSVLKCFL